MMKKNFLANISKDLRAYQKERNAIFGKSRQILQAAKESIFATHRQDYKKAADFLKKAEIILKELSKNYDKANRLRFEGSYKAALEEYVEAKFFYMVMTGKQLRPIAIGSIGPEEYIGGLADLTGELVRQAVLQTIAENYDRIQPWRDLTEEIVGFMTKLYLTGSSRQKFDESKRNLKRLEKILYDIKLRPSDD